MADRALDGIKVVEYGNLVTAPYCAKLLADLGADVIKVEDPILYDDSRRRGPFMGDIPHKEKSGLYLFLNTNKKGITLNLREFRGKEIFSNLIKDADILVIDKSPQEKKALGLEYESLSSLNPKLVVSSITPFGETGPYRDYKSYCLNTLHASGEGYLVPGGVEYLDRPPTKVGTFYTDFICGVIAAIGTLATWYYVDITGLGQHLDISKQEAAMFYQRWGVVRYANENLVISRATEGYWFGGILPCKDGFTVFWCVQAHEWERMKNLMGNPVWTESEKFKEFGAVILNGEEANAYILEWLVNYTGKELYHMGQEAGVPFGMMMTSEDLLSSEQLRAREFFVSVNHPEVGTIDYPSAPYKLSETPWHVDRPAPLRGEHNEEVYYDRLGFTKEHIVRLRAAGII